MLKYSPAGELLLTAQHRYTGFSDPVYQITDLLVGDSGHVYLAVQAYDRSRGYKVLVVKFSPNGSVLWEHSAFNGYAGSIALDQQGNVYAIGYDKYALVKISAGGETLWMKEVDIGVYELQIGPGGTIYLVGSRMSEDTGQDYATIAFDPEGNVLWREYYHGTGVNQGSSEHISALAIDSQENVYVNGDSTKRYGHHQIWATVAPVDPYP